MDRTMQSLSRHAIDLRYKRRLEWLAKGGVTPEAFAKSISTLLAGMEASRPLKGKGGEEYPSEMVADWPTRVKSAQAFTELVRHSIGLDSPPYSGTSGSVSQTAVVFQFPAWVDTLAPQLKESIQNHEDSPQPPQNLQVESERPTDSAAEPILEQVKPAAPDHSDYTGFDGGSGGPRHLEPGGTILETLPEGRCHAIASKRQGGQPCLISAGDGERFCKHHKKYRKEPEITDAEIVERNDNA